MKRLRLFLFPFFLSLFAQAREPRFFASGDYCAVLKQVTDVMVYDVTSPVAASRYYAYVTLAANEVYAALDPSAASFKHQLKDFEGISVDVSAVPKHHASFAALYALYKMGEKLLPSGSRLQPLADSLAAVAVKKGISKEVVAQSVSLVNEAIRQIMKYVQADGFKNLSGYARYQPLAGDGYWQPTAPVFMQPVEPWWFRLRPFVLDSCRQFKPAAPLAFDTVRTSAFYQLLQEVYTTQTYLTEEQRAIAAFWDCNPFAVQQIGHVEFGLKRLSPGAHWMGITGIACQKKKTTLAQTLFLHTLVAVTLADGFIACWDEKYRSNRVRPETAVNKFVDPAWRPLLQTPPFPEYPSGHSVISTAVATVLTHYFGPQFAFTDTTEQEFDLPPRAFSSFQQAAEEAAISRLYGGIHYRDAIVNGQTMGWQIGECVWKRIKASTHKALK
jgi:membrane-associated phospholipid phosphatase